MILCPWLLTTFQMWTFDYILKSKNNQSYNDRVLILNDQDEDRSINSEYTLTDDSFSSVTLTE